MGLFSKKTLTCESCGKEYEARVAIGAKLCPECAARLKQKKALLAGYVDCGLEFGKDYTEKELDEILQHRDAILEKYRCVDGITLEELRQAELDRDLLTDEQCEDILRRAVRSEIDRTSGAAYTHEFFMPTTYPGTVVDAEDVFAVCFSGDTRHNIANDKVDLIVCTLFTNDPYIPVFPMVFVGKIRFFEVLKSKEGRAGVSALFETICPNLSYPVDDVKKIRKQIKQEDCVRGNLSKDFMMEQLNIAQAARSKQLTSDLTAEMVALLDEYGYMTMEQVARELHLDKLIKGHFWAKQMDRTGIII